MKRFLSVLLCLSMMLPLFGCAREEAEIQKPVTFYYRKANVSFNDAESVIAREQRESYGHEGDIPYLMGMYLKGPSSADFHKTFPADTFIVSIHYMDNLAKIVFSFHFAELSGIDLTVACACVTMTMMELTDVESVQISAAGALLDDYQSITMNKDSLLLLDNGTKGK